MSARQAILQSLKFEIGEWVECKWSGEWYSAKVKKSIQHLELQFRFNFSTALDLEDFIIYIYTNWSLLKCYQAALLCYYMHEFYLITGGSRQRSAWLPSTFPRQRN